MREACTNFAEKLAGLFSEIVFKTMTVELLREQDDLDITLSQLQALQYVAEHRMSSVGEIAEGLGVTHPAAVKVVQRLQEKHLVTRTVSDADHRQAAVSVAPAGRALVNAARLRRTDRLSRVLDRMSPADRAAMIRGLEAFVTIVLQDEGALDQLCHCCQTLEPTDCVDFSTVLARVAVASSKS
ncbi:MAG: MarR family transcriptional regulator [Armatimonadetes bacterium]|nr:MarR family transcriptional regulator [Armatimonadota bacterium]